MNEYIAGGFSGLTQTISGHWLDTIKVNKQNGKKTIYDARSLNKGITNAIYSNIVANSFVFGFNNTLEKNMNPFASGFITGGVIGLASTPFENKKIQMQNRCKEIRYFRSIEMGVLRDSLSFSIYFGFYRILREKYEVSAFNAGGITGLLSWVLTYPIDVISTRMKSNYSMTLQKAIKIPGLWNGILICSVRSLLVNSIGFYSYEKFLENV